MRRQDERTSAEEVVLRLVQDHAAELLRFARRFSHCADDAHDAYQRSLEILVRRMRDDPPAEPLRWLRTVLRHEALSVRAQRDRLVDRFEIDLDRQEDRRLGDPADRAVGHERLRHTAEALQRLKPQEVTALVLRAEGLTYKEICARTGWTYTRCNRAVTEGRRALLARLGAIESGAECERWTPLLSLLADGEASASELAALRPHLRACPSCRATLRHFHATPAQIAALVPPALVPLATEPAGGLLGHAEVMLHALAERATLAAMRLQGAVEALPGAKVAAVAASTAALAGGGAALERAAQQHPPRAAAHAAPAPAASAPGLVPIAAPLPSGSPRRGQTRRPTRQGEFASAPTSPSEFAHGAAPVGEFASAAPPPDAAAAVAPPVGSPPQTSAPPEFARP
jgi:RNA polymerase sigma factor (sigma-70 family)